MGTFKIRPTNLEAGGSIYYPNIDSLLIAFPGGIPVRAWYAQTFLPDAPTIVQIVSTQSADVLTASLRTSVGADAFSDTLRFNFVGNSIYLDGSLTPISINNLPIGWTPLTAILSVYPTPTLFQSANQSNHYFLQLGTLTEGVQDTPSLAYSSPPTAIDLITNGCGIRIAETVANAAGIGDIELNELVIEGTYGINQTQAQIVQQDPSTPVATGDSVRFIITTAEAGDLQTQGTTIYGTLDNVTQIQLSWVDLSGNAQTTLIDDTHNAYSIIIHNSSELVFTLPLGFGSFSGPVNITFVFEGTQFSGSVLMGTLQVLFENASGIYALNTSQTNDELYVRAGFTTDTKQIFLPDMRSDEIYYANDDLFSMLTYPRRILMRDDIDEEEFEQSDFSKIAITRQVIIIQNVDIPSPFVKIAFLP